jgi:hypothetical protein
MSYKLKPGTESFEVVDGPFAGKKFLRGKIYKEVPPEEKKKFEKIRDLKGQGPRIEKLKPRTPDPEPRMLKPEPRTLNRR